MNEKYRLRSNFCVLIISYGRADNVKTARLLKKQGYTGPWYVVCSTDDAQLGKYKKNYGERVIVFDKEEIAQTFDQMDNSGQRKLGCFARQACFPIARKLGYKYFLSLDDDYHSFDWRYHNYNCTKMCSKKCKNLDRLFELMLRFLDKSGAWEVDFACGGDFLGGANNPYTWCDLLYKARNSHFNDVDKHIRYHGNMNDDINAYVFGWMQGRMFFSPMLISVVMDLTQQIDGGMKEAYLDIGGYVQKFYTVMIAPSACKISAFGESSIRLHHKIEWNNCAPKILKEKWKKN